MEKALLAHLLPRRRAMEQSVVSLRVSRTERLSALWKELTGRLLVLLTLGCLGMLIWIMVAAMWISAANARPANDNFANAQSISGSTVSVDGTTEGATVEGGEPAPDPNSSDPSPGEHTVWYRWTAPTSGSTIIDTCRANIDSILTVYTGSGLDTLDRVVDNNDDHSYCGSDSLGSKVTFDAQAGTTYHISVGDTGALQQSTFTLKLSGPDTTPPTVISTFPANGGEVGPAANIRATFSEEMRSASVMNAFKLVKKGSTTQISAQVSYDAATDTATLNPNNNLRRGVTYKAVVSTVAKDEAGNRLDQNSSKAGLQQKVWFFEID